MEAVMEGAASSPLSSDLTCSVCMDIILPPIRMCSNKHNICVACNTRLVRHAPGNCRNRECQCRKVLCPVCRTDIKGTKLLRNNDLETLAKKDTLLKVPCPYAPDCTETLSYLNMINHVSQCPKKPANQQPIELESDSESPDNEGPTGMIIFSLVNALDMINAAIRDQLPLGDENEDGPRNDPLLIAPVPPVSPIAPRTNIRMHGGTRELPMRAAVLRNRYNIFDEPYPARQIFNADNDRRTTIVKSSSSSDNDSEESDDSSESGDSNGDEMASFISADPEEEESSEEEEESNDSDGPDDGYEDDDEEED